MNEDLFAIQDAADAARRNGRTEAEIARAAGLPELCTKPEPAPAEVTA